MALYVHRSNRLERLADQLAQVVREPLADPLARECIVVQGPGMERWLAGTLSRSLGIWANPDFPFPRALIERFVDAVLGPPAEERAGALSPEALTFRIATLLPDMLSEPGFAEIAAYLRDDLDGERLLELSRRIARTFDDYVVYRPDLVLRWEAGEGEHFQARLLRALVKGGGQHLAQRMRAFERALAEGRAPRPHRDDVPERVSLFGISTLPPSLLALLARIAEHVDVHLFLLTPSREYWGDLDRREQRRSDLHGFLAQVGKLGREFVDAIETLPYREPSDDLFEAPGHDSMLHALQSDLVELRARSRHPRADAGHEAPLAIDERDQSLRVHVCHSPVRELEVLRDQLRARFEADPTLEPRDVIVFTPDIERYAPAIEAVFAEADARDPAFIPYRIADRRSVRTSEVAEAFFALLELLSSRLHLSDVLDLLHRECVRARFDIAEAEIDRLQHWLVSAGARWAADAAHRTRFEQPAFGENSLRFALDRLLVGYAARDGEERELFEVLPASEVEGRDALELGKLARYLETLCAWVERLSLPQPPGPLSAALIELLAATLGDAGERGIEHHVLRNELAELANDAERGGFARPMTLASFARLLEERLERGRANLGFLAGGVTFCEPVPMRAIPFRLVCLLGMDDASFPRSSARPGFDLMAAEPRAGDRTLRDDDRQLFLEALLSAREALHVSYVGRSAQDAAERPASVLVDQLLRLCDQHFVFADRGRTLSLALEGSVAEALLRVHALHRFDPRYFRPSAEADLFSYDERAALAARALRGDKRAPPRFVPAPLGSELEGKLVLSIDALQRFFKEPQRGFLHERLKLYLPRELDGIEDREPLVLDALERFRIADELLAQRETRARGERARLLARAGRLAPGSIGGAQLSLLERLVDGVLEACPAGEPRPDREISLELPSGRLHGRLAGIERDARVVRSVGKLYVKRRLGVFIEHLALCAGGPPLCTRLVGREDRRGAEVLELAPIEQHDAEQLLDRLLQLYRVGMSMPLPLLHDAATCYLAEREKGSDEATALACAQLELARRRPGQRGPLDDPYVREVWSEEQLSDLANLWAGDGVVTLRFVDVAEQVLGPMLRYAREVKS